MDCPSETQLAELADGHLPATGAARVQAHVDGCTLCQKALRSLVASEATVVESSLDGLAALQSGWADSTQLKSLVGERVGEYRVEELIGSGGMGIVYRGVHPMIGRSVAIKVLRPELAADAANVEAMLTEARAVASIGHRGIVDVFAYGELPDGRHYMVMELLNGEALNRLIRREAPLKPARVVELCDAILDSLEAAHEAGVIHRDLKPSNLYVVKQKSGVLVKLLDFGLAKRGASSGQTVVSLMGTPGYMAPEQIKLHKTDARTDLYSLGIVAFELATGQRPFKADDMAALLVAHTEKPPPLPSSLAKVPKELERWILELLAKNPEDRPESATVVRERLQKVKLEDPPVTVSPPDLKKTMLGEPQFAGPRDDDETEAAGAALKEAPTGLSEIPATDPSVQLPRRNWLPIAGVVAAGLVLLVGAILFATSGETNASKQVIELPSPYATRPAPKPIEVKPPEPPKPVEAAPEPVKPVEVAAVKPPTRPDPHPGAARPTETSQRAKLLARVQAVKAKLDRAGEADSLATVMVQDAENNVKTANNDESLKHADKLVRDLERRYAH